MQSKNKNIKMFGKKLFFFMQGWKLFGWGELGLKMFGDMKCPDKECPGFIMPGSEMSGIGIIRDGNCPAWYCMGGKYPGG